MDDRVDEAAAAEMRPTGELIDFALRTADRSLATVEEKLPRDRQNRLQPLVSSAVLLFLAVPSLQGLVRHDVFSDEYLLTGAPPGIERGTPLAGPYPRPWSAVDVIALQAYFQRRYKARWTVETVEAAMRLTAASFPVHPVLDWLDGLRWDGAPRLDSWLQRAFGCPDDEFHRAVAAKTLVAAVRRVRSPGCKHDHVLVVEGRQGQRKSTLLRALFGDPWFSDALHEHLAGRDAAMSLVGVWGLEIAEIEQIIRNEPGTVKAFFSRSTDRYRPPYARAYVARPRQGILIGTTNEEEWLRDATGNRRFWPVRAVQADVEWVEANRAQLWAEAAAREAAGEAIWLDTDELRQRAEAEQDDRLVEDAWGSTVFEWLGEKRWTTLADVMTGGLNLPRAQQNRTASLAVGRILREAGWSKRRVMVGGRRVWRWYAADVPPWETAPV